MLHKIFGWVLSIVSILVIIGIILAVLLDIFGYVTMTGRVTSEVRTEYNLPKQMRLNVKMLWGDLTRQNHTSIKNLTKASEHANYEQLSCVADAMNSFLGNLEEYEITDEETLKKYYQIYIQGNGINYLWFVAQSLCERAKPSSNPDIQHLDRMVSIAILGTYVQDMHRWQREHYPTWQVQHPSAKEIYEHSSKSIQTILLKFGQSVAPTPTLR